MVVQLPAWYWVILIPLGMLIVVFEAYGDDGTIEAFPIKQLRWLALTIFRSITGLRILWWVAAGLHISESLARPLARARLSHPLRGAVLCEQASRCTGCTCAFASRWRPSGRCSGGC